MCLFSRKKEKRQHKRKLPKNYILRLFFSRPLAENPLHFKTRDGKIFLKYVVPRIGHSVLQGRNINSDTREGQSGNVSEQAEGSMAALTAELAVP